MQLVMPRGGEERARRAYFAGSLGLAELEKPLTLAGRAGSGTLPDGRRLHLGVEELFRPSAKAHPASKGGALDGLAWRLDGVTAWCGGTGNSSRSGDSTGKTRSVTGSSSSSRRVVRGL
ncbi:MAG TPA: hypothetical protein VE568_13575 [Rubrobacter sp.]|nr:hypothetical protein [Rubrobacter sp.]